MNIYQYALLSSIAIILLFIAAWVASFAAQYIWAWIDDSKPIKGNILSRFINYKIRMTKWVYPVFNAGELHGYAKNKKYKNQEVCGHKRGHSLEEGTDYKYTFEVMGSYWKLCFLFSLVPFVIVLSLNFSLYVTTVFILFLVAFLSRYVRRINKKLKSHIEDKKAHTETKG